jgi:hypothetical protein
VGFTGSPEEKEHGTAQSRLTEPFSAGIPGIEVTHDER